ncbi:MAG: response regulator [Bdellovibrionales bacterium]|nr:response regulator [Bdellovibrionales bacterium]
MFRSDTHILVVDDSINIRRIVVDHLQKLGFSKIVAAENTAEALEKLKSYKQSGSPIQLVLSDLNMPGPSGLDFLKEVRKDPQYQALPFILITTESEKGAVIEAAVNGVSGYIVKPFNADTLTKRLKEAYRKHYPEGLN